LIQNLLVSFLLHFFSALEVKKRVRERERVFPLRDCYVGRQGAHGLLSPVVDNKRNRKEAFTL